MTAYLPPVGVWRSTPARRLLWAVEQVRIKLEREIPERGAVNDWTGRFRDLLNDPVQAFDWEGWYASNVAKADEPDVPDELAGLGGDVADEVPELWEAAAAARTAGLTLPHDPQDLARALEATMDLVRGIPGVQRDALRRMMARAMEAQDGQFGFARQMRREWAEFSKARSELIAVTEWNRAASTATRLSYEKQGVTLLRWFTVGDDRVCSVCEGNAAEGEVPINVGFQSGHDNPPAHPGCRCNIASA